MPREPAIAIGMGEIRKNTPTNPENGSSLPITNPENESSLNRAYVIAQAMARTGHGPEAYKLKLSTKNMTSVAP